MVLKTLVENTVVSEDFHGEHGLSLYMEAGDHKILLDVGDSSLYGENAEKMQVDLTAVDTVVISHGHYDHGGGLSHFLHKNQQAAVYISKYGFEDYYAKDSKGHTRYVGLDQSLKHHDQIRACENRVAISQTVEIFSGVQGRKCFPRGNAILLKEENGELVPDDFTHEQNLVIQEKGRQFLFAGCAHNGILNILEEYVNLYGGYPDYVISGFHLHNHSTGEDEDPETLRQIGETLKKTGAMYYTGHCTGTGPFDILKEVMGEKVDYLATGSRLEW